MNGMPSVSTLLKVYKIGDIVDIKADGSVHAGMPHKYYHGRTGRVFNVTNRSLGVVVSKPVRNRIEKKKICIRAEHVRHSSCRQDFLDRVKRNDTTRRECKKNGTAVPDLKRKPVGQDQPTSSGLRTTSPPSSNPFLTNSSFNLAMRGGRFAGAWTSGNSMLRGFEDCRERSVIFPPEDSGKNVSRRLRLKNIPICYFEFHVENHILYHNI